MMDEYTKLLLAVIDQKIALAKQRRVHQRKPVRGSPVWTCLPESRSGWNGHISLGGGCYMAPKHKTT